MPSIRNKLMLYIVVGAALLLVVTGIAVDRLLYAQLAAQFDRNLWETASNLMSLAEQDEGIIEFDYEAELMPQFDDGEQPLYFHLRRSDGVTLARSPSLGDAELEFQRLDNVEPIYQDIALPDGRDGRSVAFAFEPFIDLEPDDDSHTDDQSQDQNGILAGEENNAQDVSHDSLRAYLTVARGTGELRELAFTFRIILGTAFIVLMLAMLLLIRGAITSGLKPLNLIADQVKGLNERSLHQRVTLMQPTQELAPISDQLNRLLERLDHAFQREKRFSGNVAHELRTPIAELRALAEIGREWPEERAMVEGFFGDLVDIANDMERTVANLLTLARVDAGNQTVVNEKVMLRDLLDILSQRFDESLADNGQSVDNQIPKDLVVRSDVEKLSLILVNILSNAVTYGEKDTVITVCASEFGGRIEIDITNVTSQLDENDLVLMFDRFWRKDVARSRRNNAGIGLSLVAALADVLGISLKPKLEDRKLFTLSLSGLTPA